MKYPLEDSSKENTLQGIKCQNTLKGIYEF